VAWTALGVGNGIVNADVSTVLLNRTPDDSRGRVLARVNAMLRGSALAATALGGALGTALCDRATFVVSGLLMLAVGTVLLIRITGALRKQGS